MALFRDLSRTIAEVEGLSEMTVTGVGQYLRDAGLISKHGRGRAAAHMTCVDAVNLIVGVNATALAKDAPEYVRLFMDLTKVTEHCPVYESVTDEDAFSRALHKPKSSGSCLVDLLKCYVPGESGNAVLDENGLSVRVAFSRPRPCVSIWAGSEPQDDQDPGETIAWLEFEDGQSIQMASGDRRDQTTITEQTLSAVGRLLAK